MADADGSFRVPAQPLQRPPPEAAAVDAAASTSGDAAADAAGTPAQGARPAAEGHRPRHSGAVNSTTDGPGPVPAPQELRLEPGRWARAWAAWRPRRAGPTRASEVVLRLGAGAEVVWSLAAFPAGAELMGPCLGVVRACLADCLPPDSTGAENGLQ